MIKVIISDDEYKICRLIHSMVDWNSLDMEVVAYAHDGVEAIQLVKEYKPDILITDIRMPGLNGLELIERASVIKKDMGFIIISGYSEFEYARRALSFGVVEYLVKPVNREELLSTLQRFKQIHEKNTQDTAERSEYHQLSKKNIENLRKGWLEEAVLTGAPDENVNLINEKNRYHFQTGYFQVLIVKIYGDLQSNAMGSSFIHQKLMQLFQFELKESIFDLESVASDAGQYIFLVNYKASREEIMRKYRQILRRILFQKDILQNMDFCIGVGGAYEKPGDIRKSYRDALTGVQQRLILGENAVIEGDRISHHGEYSSIFSDFSADFERAVELLSEEDIRNVLKKYNDTIITDRNVTGHDVIQMLKAAVNIFIFTLDKTGFHFQSSDEIFEELSSLIDNTSELNSLILRLGHEMVKMIRNVKTVRQKEGTKPVRDVKQYIKEHISENISVDELSSLTGYNSAYFSTLFKKETGITVSEYIIQARMEYAKELLKTSNDSISAICRTVGYSDEKTFTKNFRKVTNLKPSEYRKLFS